MTRFDKSPIGQFAKHRNDVCMFPGLFEAMAQLPCPLWLPNAALMLSPLLTAGAIAVLSWREGDRPLAACERCGYDISASPIRCPECGRVRSTRPGG